MTIRRITQETLVDLYPEHEVIAFHLIPMPVTDEREVYLLRDIRIITKVGDEVNVIQNGGIIIAPRLP